MALNPSPPFFDSLAVSPSPRSELNRHHSDLLPAKGPAVFRWTAKRLVRNERRGGRQGGWLGGHRPDSPPEVEKADFGLWTQMMPEKVHSSYKPKVIKDKDDVKNQSFWLGSGLAQDSAARNVPVTHGTIPRNKLEKEPIRNHQICSDPNPFLSGTQAQTRRLVKRTPSASPRTLAAGAHDYAWPDVRTRMRSWRSAWPPKCDRS